MDGLLNKAFAPAISARARFEEKDGSTPPVLENAAERLNHLQRLCAEFSRRAESIQAPFSILLHGSTAYGYSEKASSNFHDIDLAVVMSPSQSVEDFLEMARYVFNSDLSVDRKTITGLLNGTWDICRMYGETEGVQLEFFIIRQDTFRYLATDRGSRHAVKDRVDPKQKVFIERVWSIKDWRQIISYFDQKVIMDEDGSESTIINHRFLSDDGHTLMGLGSRLLLSVSLHEPTTSGHNAKILLSYWYIYVRASLAAHPELTNDDIINAFVRAERFSPEYRAYLSGIIDEIRRAL